MLWLFLHLCYGKSRERPSPKEIRWVITYHISFHTQFWWGMGHISASFSLIILYSGKDVINLSNVRFFSFPVNWNLVVKCNFTEELRRNVFSRIELTYPLQPISNLAELAEPNLSHRCALHKFVSLIWVDEFWMFNNQRLSDWYLLSSLK